MHIKYDKVSTLKIKYGHLIVETEAIWKDKRRKIQEINIDKGVRYQGVYYSTICGYGVVFEGEKYYRNSYNYYGNEILQKESWGRYGDYLASPAIYDSRYVTQEEYELIYSIYPDFKYTVNKMKNGLTITSVLYILNEWRNHPQEVEMLYALGYPHFIGIKSLYTLKKDKKDKLIKFLLKCSKMGKNNMTFKQARQWSNIKNFDFDYMNCCNSITYDVYVKRLKGADSDTISYWRWHYKDYLKLCAEQGHNIKDDYWKYPKDLKERHDKLMEEKARIEAAKRIEEFKPLEKRIKKYLKYNSMVEGYEILFTANPEEWLYQAKCLHQCIVASEYYKKTTCILAFIRKDSLPIATVEIKKNKEIGQFYADERDRANCLPNEEVKEVFYKWFENVNIGARL